MPKNNRRKRSSKSKNMGTFPRESSLSGQAILFGNGLDNRVNIVTRCGYLDVNITAGTTIAQGISFLQTGFYVNSSFISWTSGVTDLAALYDFYRLERVQVSFMFDNTMSGIEKVTKTMPYFFSAIDYNDATVSTVGDITQMSTCECRLMTTSNDGMVFTKTFTPRAQFQVYAGASTAYAEATPGTWFNSSSTPIHYGLKTAVDASLCTDTTGVIGHYRIFVKAFMSAKQPK